jgi:hypothetical protein
VFDLADPAAGGGFEVKPEPEIPKVLSIQDVDDKNAISRISFNEFDHVLDMGTNREEKVLVPKKSMQDKLAETILLENFDLGVQEVGNPLTTATPALTVQAEDPASLVSLLNIEEI